MAVNKLAMNWKRKMMLTALIVLCIAPVVVFGNHGNDLRISDLTCEYRTNPVGISSPHPRFSWIIHSSRQAVKQSAYRIIVSDDALALKEDKGNIWDSGKVPSGESIQVPYNGPSLKAAKKYYWKVRIWDNLGNASGWSLPATWRMGLLNKADWHGAQWIAFDELPPAKRIVPAAHLGGKSEWGTLSDTLPLLRKEFIINKPIQEAVIFISGLGHFDLSINGEKISDDFLDPGWSLYSRQALYVGFDVTKQLQSGVNAIGVMLGNGFYHVPAERYRKITGTYGHPKMICRLLLLYKDGDTANIVSDADWKTAPGPVTFSSIYGGEDYDARLEQPGWNRPGFNDTPWRPVTVVDGPPGLDASVTEPLKVMQVFTPVKIDEPQPGVYVYDFGQNFSGIPEIFVEGKAGDKVKLIPGEILDSNGLVNQQPSGRPAYFEYTLKGGGPESWHPQFTYYGFRYIQVENGTPPGKPNPKRLPVISKIKGLHTRLSADSVGSFACSNELFNKIFKLIDWSIKSNLASVLTDCPHREKLGWLEVAHLLGNSLRYNYNIASLYRKIIEDMKMSQTANGLVPNIAPEYVQFDTDFRDSPEWGSSSVILPYYLFKWYGDKRVLADSYNMMKRYVDYLGTKANDHIVSHGLGDWFDIGPNGSGSGYSISTPQGVTGTAIYYYDLQILREVASILGNKADANKYHRLSEAVKEAFNKKFFNRNTKQYATGSQTANAMAVFMGLAPADDKDAVVANIKKDIIDRGYRLTSGEVGYKHLLAVLKAEGESELIFDMNSRSDVPGYGYQIAHGATTLMEDWQAIKTLGNNHCMLGHLLGWLYSGLGGIRQLEGALAFKKIIIAPEIVGDITSVYAKYKSPYGLIVSEWEKDDSGFNMNVEIPVNTDAVIYLPVTEGSEIFIDGRKINKAEIENAVNGKIGIKLGSGDYRITTIKPSDNKNKNKNKNKISSLIPLPQSVRWLDHNFDLEKCESIVISDGSLQNEVNYLQEELKKTGFTVTTQSSSKQKKAIWLTLSKVEASRNLKEAYHLSVTADSIIINANTSTGIFNGIQTLLQLINGTSVKACEIADYPAYRWRGYMVDVGRNYQSPAQLKQQIDMMARYKLNVFHFHLTEDIAWRLQIKKYPQLTSAKNMLRNKGKYYSIEEMKELIEYCKKRHITLVPEIDIPGHSKAFTRAMGVDMQSEKGTSIVKDIFEEICTTYDVPFIHIGADEVKITNPSFIPEISAVIRKHNKQIVAWAPGGNYDNGIVRQLWKDEGDKDVHNNSIKYIDSKFLYISDFDPHNSVVTIFNRQLGGEPHGDTSLLGAEFCLWNDRKVTEEEDLISKNPVYPAMLAFAERSWRGSGRPGVLFFIGNTDEQRAQEYKGFETRILSHKQKYFSRLPFVYAKQMHIRWKLFGPFENNGNLSAAYWPEKNQQHLSDSNATVNAVGGTVWLWHTHGPEVKAWLRSPKENTTWYAFTRFWSDSDSTIHAWVDVKDLSRSGADATPPKGQWDQMQSRLWINGERIPPPNWKFAGRPSGRLDEPMVDETFYYRPPLAVKVKKGWNEVLFKLPMGKFDPNLDWQVPPKWMFTFIPVHKGQGINWQANNAEFNPGR